MKFNLSIAAFFALLFLLNTSPAASQSNTDWVLKRDKGGIKVFVREIPDSKIKELKFSTRVEASLHTIAAVLTHVEGFNDWVYASVESRTIKQVSDTEVYYYTVMDFPWPFDDRDLVLHSNFWQDPKTLAIHSHTTSVHWMEGEKDELVRIKKAELHWTFTPVSDGTVKVEYYLNSDPAGNIPAWMINLAADQGPLQTMVKFKEMLAMEKYKNQKLAFVQEMK